MTAATNGTTHAPRPRAAAVARMVVNAYMDRLLRGRGRGAEMDRRRDVRAECGWPESPTAHDFVSLCRSSAYAAKAASILPDWTWSVHPEVYEDEDEAVTTPFEKALREIDAQLGTGSRLRQPCAGALAWPWLAEADRLANLGRYSCLLIGTDDGLPLEAEPQPRAGTKLTYLRAFSECDAKVSELDRDPLSPRYNQPLEYEVTLRSPDDPGGSGGESVAVHWRRVLHFTGGAQPVYSDYFLGPVLPHLLDLRKVCGADAEGYWQWGFPLFAFETPPELGGDIDVDEDSLRDELEKIFHGLKRWILSKGAQARTLSPELADPAPHVLIQLQAVCAYLDCPLRVFLGSEEGKMASGQDSRRWHGVGRDRRDNFATPRRVAPFIDRLVWLGVLPEPESYTAFWPDTEVQTLEEKARTAQMNTQALAAYAQSEAWRFVGPQMYLTAWQGRTAAEALAMIEGAETWVKDNPEFVAATAAKARPPEQRPRQTGAAGEGRQP
jgi:hypothetical protein